MTGAEIPFDEAMRNLMLDMLLYAKYCAMTAGFIVVCTAGVICAYDILFAFGRSAFRGRRGRTDLKMI